MDPFLRVPDADDAVVDPRKIREYLLSPAHPIGRGKARFFMAFGFRADHWQTLERALREIVATHPISAAQDTPFGTRYIVDGLLTCPDGRRPAVRTVWFRDAVEAVPRFVTAYGR